MHLIGRAVVLVSVVLGCGGESQVDAHFLRTDSAGISIVTIDTPPADTVRPGSPLVIGSADLNAPVETSFELISDLAVVGDGSVAVVDNRGGRIGLFAPDGTWRRDVGGRGEGPGEFVSPLWVDVSDDTLFVWDARLRRLSAYTPDGEFAGSWPIAGKSHAGRLAVVGGTLLDEVEWGQLDDPAPAAGALVRRNRSGAIEDTLVGPYRVPEYGWQAANEAGGSGRMTNPPALDVGPAWTTAGNSLYVLFPRQGEVVVLSGSDGEVRERFRLPSSARPVTPDDRRRFVAGIVDRFGGDATAVEEGTAFADTISAYAGLLVDDQERVWVSDQEPAAFLDGYVGSTWTVVDAGNEELWSVVFPRAFRLHRVTRGMAYGVTREHNGVEVVHVYPLSPPPVPATP